MNQKQPNDRFTKERILEALSQVYHPQMETRSLVELGMIKDVQISSDRLEISLALPFRKVPAREKIETSIHARLAALAPEVECKIEIVEMSPEQRASFNATVQGRDPEDHATHEVKQVVAVMSGKGGVGKSSVAGLLASALNRRGHRVGVLDADITGPSIPHLFGMKQAPTSGPEGIVPPETEQGIKLISINLLLPNENQPVVWRGPLIARAIQQFWSDIAWGDLDYLIVDLPPGTSDAAITVMQSLPLHGIVLVTSPQDLAGMVVRKAAIMAQNLGIRILGLVENMSFAICPNCGTKIEIFGPSQAQNTAETSNIPLLGTIPLDPQLAVMCDAGRVESYEGETFEPVLEEIFTKL